MHARSAVFDVYGDLLADRDHKSTVAGLVRLLAPVGITAPAVRTAVSRMVSQGWLTPVRLPQGRGYSATDRAVQRFQHALERAYHPANATWDNTWHVVLTQAPTGRTERARLTRELTYLGYAQLQENTWVSPYARAELADTLERNATTAVTVRTADVEPSDAFLKAWDLDALARSYRTWHAQAADQVAHHLAAHADPEEAAFAARFHLAHEWRKFLFSDPGLPLHLLPADWPGVAAAVYFNEQAERLNPAATAFVDRVLAED
ncbi:PaaX family transcriptional regulator C-terminal domain-containing protein [Nocardioides yefusunii]|uniref:PaaX family transcriptional regulator C-terminal domain-containing protein n=1 Tax=Nocardioides yefusunii TaxID=2500546 RepID=A0ABW1QSX8_9ACTN|nr:PaaX family transcriptional regulator C-terminal domain-containing protein [Nocardioides yefusunii]